MGALEDDVPVMKVVGFLEDGQLAMPGGVTDVVLENLEDLADWSDWIPFAEALAVAPKLPGVYIARAGKANEVVYVGMAGERRGSGLRGRLSVVQLGQGACLRPGRSGVRPRALGRGLASCAACRCGGRPAGASKGVGACRFSTGRPADPMGDDS